MSELLELSYFKDEPRPRWRQKFLEYEIMMNKVYRVSCSVCSVHYSNEKQMAVALGCRCEGDFSVCCDCLENRHPEDKDCPLCGEKTEEYIKASDVSLAMDLLSRQSTSSSVLEESMNMLTLTTDEIYRPYYTRNESPEVSDRTRPRGSSNEFPGTSVRPRQRYSWNETWNETWNESPGRAWERYSRNETWNESPENSGIPSPRRFMDEFPETTERPMPGETRREFLIRAFPECFVFDERNEPLMVQRLSTEATENWVHLINSLDYAIYLLPQDMTCDVCNNECHSIRRPKAIALGCVCTLERTVCVNCLKERSSNDNKCPLCKESITQYAIVDTLLNIFNRHHAELIWNLPEENVSLTREISSHKDYDASQARARWEEKLADPNPVLKMIWFFKYCNICSEDFKQNGQKDASVALGCTCAESFSCHKCLKKHLQRSRKCPFCRKTITEYMAGAVLLDIVGRKLADS